MGETGRTLDERVKEHKRKVKGMEVTSSEIAKHVMDTGHLMEWTGARILEREVTYGKRIFKEAWWTRRLNAENRTKQVISDAWTPFIK